MRACGENAWLLDVGDNRSVHRWAAAVRDADLPGVPKERLALQVEGDTLSIEGELALAVPEGMEASHVEVKLPRYRRVFTLSRELDPNKVEAKFEHGVLTLRIPKAEHAQPRRVEVQIG